MKILYHHRTASKDGQAVHIEEMIDAMRTLGHQVRVVAPSIGGPADQQGAMGAEVGWVHRLKAALPKFVYELLERNRLDPPSGFPKVCPNVQSL